MSNKIEVQANKLALKQATIAPDVATLLIELDAINQSIKAYPSRPDLSLLNARKATINAQIAGHE